MKSWQLMLVAVSAAAALAVGLNPPGPRSHDAWWQASAEGLFGPKG